MIVIAPNMIPLRWNNL